MIAQSATSGTIQYKKCAQWHIFKMCRHKRHKKAQKAQIQNEPAQMTQHKQCKSHKSHTKGPITRHEHDNTETSKPR